MAKLVLLQESHFADVKAMEISPAKLSKSLSGFANADGGELYIGIDEDKQSGTRKWRGFCNFEAANGHIQLFEQLFPLGPECSMTFLKANKKNGLVLKIEVQKSSAIKLASDGVPYLRRGAQNLPVKSADALERLKRNKGLVSFENEICPVDHDAISNSEQIIEFMLEVIPSAEPKSWLEKQQLIKNGKPTVAGVVLFADEPQALLPKRCGIKIYRYKTKNLVGSREALAFAPISVEGSAYKQIKDAVSRTVSIIEDISVMGTKGLEQVNYPFEALHEIITNGVLHRDYGIADDVHVRIFDNRIEVESPGTLPAHVTIRNILKERFARNGSIVRLINKFPDPPNKDVGEGLNTAFDAMRNLRLKEPVIEQRENSVVVHIRHEPLASPQELIMEYLETNSSINNRKAREICFINSAHSIRHILKGMMDKKMVELVPGTRGAAIAYRKTK